MKNDPQALAATQPLYLNLTMSIKNEENQKVEKLFSSRNQNKALNYEKSPRDHTSQAMYSIRRLKTEPVK